MMDCVSFGSSCPVLLFCILFYEQNPILTTCPNFGDHLNIKENRERYADETIFETLEEDALKLDILTSAETTDASGKENTGGDEVTT